MLDVVCFAECDELVALDIVGPDEGKLVESTCEELLVVAVASLRVRVAVESAGSDKGKSADRACDELVAVDAVGRSESVVEVSAMMRASRLTVLVRSVLLLTMLACLGLLLLTAPFLRRKSQLAVLVPSVHLLKLQACVKMSR